MAGNGGKVTGSEGSSGPGVGERAPAAARPRGASAGRRGRSPARSDFDPASRPEGGPTLADEEQRQFHATHFTADPRGSAMSGAPPGQTRRKARGGNPPLSPEAIARPTQAAKSKRRGGSGPA